MILYLDRFDKYIINSVAHTNLWDNYFKKKLKNKMFTI